MKNLMKIMEFLTRDKFLTLKDEHLGGILIGGWGGELMWFPCGVGWCSGG